MAEGAIISIDQLISTENKYSLVVLEILPRITLKYLIVLKMRLQFASFLQFPYRSYIFLLLQVSQIVL